LAARRLGGGESARRGDRGPRRGLRQALAQVLAGMEGSGWSEVEPVLARVFEERDRPLPAQDEALKSVADDIVARMVVGDMEPREAVERLRTLAWRAVDTPQWEDLASFVGLASDWSESFFDQAELCEATLRVARELLDRGGVRLN
jgi:hypothetical protein